MEKGAWVSVLALAEATWVLSSVYELGRRRRAKAIEFVSHRDLVLQDPETVSAALALFRAKPALGFSDCLMLQLARKAGHLPLGTFDRSLSKVDGAQKLSSASLHRTPAFARLRIPKLPLAFRLQPSDESSCADDTPPERTTDRRADLPHEVGDLRQQIAARRAGRLCCFQARLFP